MSDYSELINYSRAGDIFHYRWAVKRCLKLLDFNTNLKCLTIEGSLEPSRAGECIVDVAEYRAIESEDINSVDYFQLKHSTAQLDKPFTLSLLKDTIVGFSQRFKEHQSSDKDYKQFSFVVLTNRPVNESFKKNILAITEGKSVNSTFKKTIKKYTKLSDKKLRVFCSLLKIHDGEGNYDAQKSEIHKELFQLTCSKEITKLTDLLVSKVIAKIEPDKSNMFTIDDILEVFDIRDLNDFFPAPPLFEEVTSYIKREQQDEITSIIEEAHTPVVITANGGVGKSVLCSHLTHSFGDSSVVIAYDCFGNGGYRQPSKKRHHPNIAFTQISNQLAKDGLSHTLIPTRQEPDDQWIKTFQKRISEASSNLKKNDEESLLVLLFDAVDNAEIAAEEVGDSCFVSLLIKEEVPENCRFVFLSRPERVDLFDPPSTVRIVKLKSFSDIETLAILEKHYTESTIDDAKEFNRLTSYNPRVQANALSSKHDSINKLLLSFDSSTLDVDDLIEAQLEQAILKVKDSFPKNYRTNINNICTALATLPPFIPIEVLARISQVEIDSVRSFIYEIGRPLWLTGNSVQFRDEPTEKWFHDNYAADVGKIREFVRLIIPLAENSSYVSEVLPILYLKAEMFDDLVNLALSEEYLPVDRPFNARKIRLYRLQFAFKAALKKKSYIDASKLALRAGEEIAGDDRQNEIISNNCDLTSIFLSLDRVQELAHRKTIHGGWEGSETVYSATLLSRFDECKGDSRNYFRSANHWLRRHYEVLKKQKEEDRLHQSQIEDLDIVEMASTLERLNGEQELVDFILSWSPTQTIFRVTEILASRLIDHGDFEKLERIANIGKKSPSLIIAISNEYSKIGRVLPKSCLINSLNQIVLPKKRLNRPDYLSNSSYSLDSFLSFFEACVINRLPSKQIIEALVYYIPTPDLYNIAEDHQFFNHRDSFLRSISIRSALNKNFNLTLDDIIPQEWMSTDTSYHDKTQLEHAKFVLNKLLPWYMVTAKVLCGIKIELTTEHLNAEKVSSSITSHSYSIYDPIPIEISRQRFKNICFQEIIDTHEVTNFIDSLDSGHYRTAFNDDINILRTSCRNEQLESLVDPFEISCCKSVEKFSIDESVDEYTDQYISLSRAVLYRSNQDAQYYYDRAINAASYLGNEAVSRWEAIVSIAKKSAEEHISRPQVAHRFIRCGEMIGEKVTREKYWDRDDALHTCFQLSPEIAFAVTNRWRERHIGRPDQQIVELANSALSSNLIASSTLWSLSAYSWETGLFEFCRSCIQKESSVTNKQIIFNDLIHDLRINNSRGKIWKQIDEFAIESHLDFSERAELDFLFEDGQEHQSSTGSFQHKSDDQHYDWDSYFGKFDILSLKGLEEAIGIYKDGRRYHRNDDFWRGCFAKATSKNAIIFFDILLEIESLDFYDYHYLLKLIPDVWKEKPPIHNNLVKFVNNLAKRFPNHFANNSEYNYILRDFGDSIEIKEAIKNGVISGYSESVDIESANALFGFARYSVNYITSNEASQLLDYGLSRLEAPIDDNFADGPWRDELLPADDIDSAFVEFIYANLGSPQSDLRWRSIHAIRRLNKLKCSDHIFLLLDLLENEKIYSSVPPQFPFYSMHARLYLLVAIYICILDDSSLVYSKRQIFENLLNTVKDHILIQLYVKLIILKIENDNKGAFSETTLNKASKICASPFEHILTKAYNYTTQSPWHMRGIINTDVSFMFGYDLESYWFEPLGRVFGISAKQVEELATEVLVNDWRIIKSSGFVDDPRRHLWNSRIGEYTHYSHGSYPSVDNYSFYLSYHSMLTVASKLLKNMPVIMDSDYQEEEWESWLSHHSLLLQNRLLISDVRDFYPAKQRSWINKTPSKDWQWEIAPDDFLDVLFSKRDNDIWVTAKAFWNDYLNEKNEEISISSILVPNGLSDSFLTTISNFDNHMHENYLGNYCVEFEKDERFGFECIEWIYTEPEVTSIGSQDPFSGNIDPRQSYIDEGIAERLNITWDWLTKSYYRNDAREHCFTNEIWSEDKPSDIQSYINYGSRFSTPVSFLFNICETLDMSIAIQVNINRSIVSTRYNRSDNEFRYIPRSSKTFIFSSDGKFRDSRYCYRLREETDQEPKSSGIERDSSLDGKSSCRENLRFERFEW